MDGVTGEPSVSGKNSFRDNINRLSNHTSYCMTTVRKNIFSWIFPVKDSYVFVDALRPPEFVRLIPTEKVEKFSSLLKGFSYDLVKQNQTNPIFCILEIPA